MKKKNSVEEKDAAGDSTEKRGSQKMKQ